MSMNILRNSRPLNGRFIVSDTYRIKFEKMSEEFPFLNCIIASVHEKEGELYLKHRILADILNIYAEIYELPEIYVNENYI